MTTAYPNNIDNFTTKLDDVSEVLAADINNVQDAIEAIERLLGEDGGENLPQHNYLYHSLTHDIWSEGTTLNDIADDTYVADLWNVVHDGCTPDISGEAGGATDPMSRYFRCTFDSNGQAGIVQFLDAEDTARLRGRTVTLEFDAWGTGVSNLRSALLSWTGTADSLTSDVVGTWGTGNPTLAANWAYVTTPSNSESISGTRARQIPDGSKDQIVPANCNNLAVFIWTPDTEGSGDLFNIANVSLCPGDSEEMENRLFVARPYQQELALVQRFYWNTTGTSGTRYATGFGMNLASTSARMFVPTPVTMRTSPTVTGAENLYSNGSAIAITSVGSIIRGKAGVYLIANVAAGLTTNHVSILNHIITGKGLEMDARL